METADDRTERVEPAKDYRRLPSAVRLEETMASVHADPVPDPEAGRNLDQHRALRDD
jgi:hypothetical protein